MTKELVPYCKWLCCHSRAPTLIATSLSAPLPFLFFFFGKCQNDKVCKKSVVAENEGILSVHEFNYHSDGST